MARRRSVVTRGILVGWLATVVVALGWLGVSPAGAQEPTVVIDGDVVYQDGPSIGSVVDLFELGADGQRSRWVGDAITDQQGEYRFEAETGCYVLVAIAPEGRTMRGSSSRYRELALCVETDTTVPTFGIIGDRPSIEGPAGTIRWTGGRPAAGVVVDLFEGSRRANRYVTSTTTAEDGTYAFEVDDPGNCYAVTAIAPDGAVFTNGAPWHNGGNCVGFLDPLLVGDGPVDSCPFPTLGSAWFTPFADATTEARALPDGRINVQRPNAALWDPATNTIQDSGIRMFYVGHHDGQAYYLRDFRLYAHDWDTGAQTEVPLVPGGNPFVHRPLITDDGIVVYEGYATADQPRFGAVTHDLATGVTTFIATYDELPEIQGYDAAANRVDFGRFSSLHLDDGTISRGDVDWPSGSGTSTLYAGYHDGRRITVVVSDTNVLTSLVYDYATGSDERIDNELSVGGFTLFRPGGLAQVDIDLRTDTLYFFGIATDRPGGAGISEPSLWGLPIPSRPDTVIAATQLGLFDDLRRLVVVDGTVYFSADDVLWRQRPGVATLDSFPNCGTPWAIGQLDDTALVATNLPDGTPATLRIG